MIEIFFVALLVLGTHLTISGGQTLLHYWLGHHRVGGILYRNHINFHHRRYARGNLARAASDTEFAENDGNNTPFFLIPVGLVVIGLYFILRIDLFTAVILSAALSFYLHVHLDNQYHVEGSYLGRFGWFRRKQQLHFMHHLHANTNFAVIDFFWDRLLGTFRRAGKVMH